MVKMKRGFVFLALVLVVVGFVSFSSAFWPFTHDEVRKSPFDVGVQVTSVPPTIPFVSEVVGDVLNTPGVLSPKVNKGVTHASVSFIAEDSNGKLDLNDASANVTFIGFSGVNNQTVSTCSKVACTNCLNTQSNYSCSLDMDYYFVSGSWTVNATIKDNSLNVAENNTKTFNYASYKQVNSSNINWGGISLVNENQTADSPLIIENWGNANFFVNINATALNGTGANPVQQIPASDFSVSRLSGGNPPIECDTSNLDTNALVDGSSVSIVSLNVGIYDGTTGSDTANAYFCLYPSLASLGLDPSQSYSSLRSWEINYA